MIKELTQQNANVVLNAAYHQLTTGKRQRFTFWKNKNNVWTMYKMKRNSKGIFWTTWKWANSWEGYVERHVYQLADEKFQPLDYRYNHKMLNGWHDRPTRLEDLILGFQGGLL